MGNRSLKTRSSPMSSRSAAAASVCSSASNARVWMSSRCGMSFLGSSFAKEIDVIVSGMSHPVTGRQKTRAPPARRRVGSSRELTDVLCEVRSLRVIEGSDEPPSALGSRLSAIAENRKPMAENRASLHFDNSALLFQLGLDARGLVLRDAGLHGLRRAVNHVLRLLEAQTG